MATAREGLSSGEPAVQASALVALWRLGALALGDLDSCLQSPSAAVRRQACDVAGRFGLTAPGGARSAGGRAPVGRPLWAGLVGRLGDEAAEVVEAACHALGELGGDGAGAAAEGLSELAVPALSAVAREHPDALCREAAVAALGALGAPGGLPAVLAALEDTVAVRRRAVLALAAFDGPEVDRALASAARARDWQVRQAAEDLIGRDRPPEPRSGHE